MKYRLDIADIGWLLETSPLDESVSLLRFQHIFEYNQPASQNDTVDVTLRVLPVASFDQLPILPDKAANPLLEGQNGAWHRYSDGSWGLWVFDIFSKRPILFMRIDASWKRAEAFYLDGEYESAEDPVHVCGDMLLRALSVLNDGFVMHASAIVHEGKAILFTAPSGTGKSTQAMLWQQHKGARILNGDRPVIRMNHGVAYAYGTPWCGKEPLFEVAKAPVGALFILEQSPENRVDLLPFKAALTSTMARVFLPLQDAALVGRGMSQVGDFVQNVPVYRLQCRPDAGAVEVVEACLKPC